MPLGSGIRYLIAARASWAVLVLLLSLHSGLDALLGSSLYIVWLGVDWLLAPVRLRDPASPDLCSSANVILCRGTVWSLIPISQKNPPFSGFKLLKSFSPCPCLGFTV